jgi:uncharacterized protein (DUF2236 family)
MKDKDQIKRREVLALGIIAGAGALAGSVINSIATDSSKQTQKMMTASGELVEVDIRHLPQKIREKPISNAALKEWMESEKKMDNNKNETI